MVDKRYPRGQWPMMVVQEVFGDKDGMVRQVVIRVKGRKLKRHVHELRLIEEATEDIK